MSDTDNITSSRRDFLKAVGAGAVTLTVSGCASAVKRQSPEKVCPVNVLLITADDMNWDTPGCYGGTVAGVTPDIDRLAAEGMLFNYAHVTVSACQPCRSVLMTGRYPHRNGAEGFEPIHNNIPTLTEQLHKAGYINGIFAKTGHLQPDKKFYWSVSHRAKAMAFGRDPKKYYQLSKEFFQLAEKNGQPFFLMANTSDPHRPFFEDADEPQFFDEKTRKTFSKPSRIYAPCEITVPGFLPDIGVVREDVRRYYCSARRCDDTVGQILRALRDSTQYENTLVMFLSDNGMGFPFSKANCYFNSTKTPWLVRWPGVVKPGTVDNRHFISTIDFMPTILDAIGLNGSDSSLCRKASCGVTRAPSDERRATSDEPGMDGFSFLPLLRGRKQKNREMVFTQFHEGVARKRLPMRSVLNRKFGYIFNPWSDGRKTYSIGYTNRASWKSMVDAAKSNPEIAARVNFFLYRAVEEFYDYENDADALNNLINDRRYIRQIEKMRRYLYDWMKRTNDPAIEAFENRHRPEVMSDFVQRQEDQSKARGGNR